MQVELTALLLSLSTLDKPDNPSLLCLFAMRERFEENCLLMKIGKVSGFIKLFKLNLLLINASTKQVKHQSVKIN